MNKVVEILCRRDGISESEAKDLIHEAIAQMDNVSWEPNECEDIMASILGLEPDYIFDLI